MVKDFHDNDDFPDTGEIIQINSLSANYHRSKNTFFHVLRSKGRNDYHILYNAYGQCDIAENGKLMPLPPKTARLYRPHERQEYIKHYGKTYWAHFTGTLLPAIAEKLSLFDGKLFVPENAVEFEAVFDRAIALYSVRSNNYEIYCAAYTMQLLAMLLPADSAVKHPAKMSEHSQLIYAAIRLMQEEMDQEFSVSKYAKRCAMSESRFSSVFKGITGMSPLRFMMKIRMDQARYLLANTALPIKEVSGQVGFADEFYFSRMFHKYVGVSPSKYRE